MQNEEIIIKAKDIKEAILSLPKEVSFGEKLFSNINDSVLGFRKITSYKESKAEMHENYIDIFLCKRVVKNFLLVVKLLIKN